GPAHPSGSPAPPSPPSPSPAVPACGATGGQGGPGTSWAPTSTRFGEAAGYDPYIGNGYLGHRVPPAGAGYAATGEKTGWPLYTPRYDGAFVSGLYARDKAVSEGREVIAALPSWTNIDVGVGEETLGPDTPAGRISHYRQTVFLFCGLVRTSLRWTTADGRATDLVYEVLADRSDVHTGAVRLRMTPRWSGTATVTGRLDDRGARRIALREDGTFRTLGTGIEGAVAQTVRRGSGVVETPRPGARTPPGATPVRAGRTYTFEKYVGVDTALTSRAPAEDAREAAHRAARRGWDRVFAANEAAWREAWSADVLVPGDRRLQGWLRSAQYGLLASTRRGSADSIAPAGLTSDNYAGMVFWDAETWMFPGLLATRPELARSVVEYRYRTRGAARANAEEYGHRGLFYPWTSASRGRMDSECQSW
ncbi:Glycosyl hydrolase family 65 central catalytic domain-containing protein, partial [Streptomyces sp. OspMP-M43]